MHPNEKLLRDADEAMARGDMEAFMGAHADDIVIHLGGRSSLAGTYKGKDQFQEVFAKFMERTPEYTFESHDYFANDEHGVILQRSHFKRGAETLDTDDVFVCHFREGKVAEIWFVTDQPYETDAFLG